MRNRFLVNMWVLTVVLLAYGQPAFAYLDPGTGSILLQGLIAGVAGVAVVLKLYWSRIKNFFSPKNAEEIRTEYEVSHKQPSDQKDSPS